MTDASGKIIEIKGGVIDAEFDVEDLPKIYDALVVEVEDGDDVAIAVGNARYLSTGRSRVH